MLGISASSYALPWCQSENYHSSLLQCAYLQEDGTVKEEHADNQHVCNCLRAQRRLSFLSLVSTPMFSIPPLAVHLNALAESSSQVSIAEKMPEPIQPWDSTLTAEDSASVNKPIVGPDLCWLYWPPLLHVYLQQAPATIWTSTTSPTVKCVHTTTSSHDHCLLWSIAGTGFPCSLVLNTTEVLSATSDFLKSSPSTTQLSVLWT